MMLSDPHLFKDRFIRAQEGWQSKAFIYINHIRKKIIPTCSYQGKRKSCPPWSSVLSREEITGKDVTSLQIQTVVNII